jgi:hypothetical protein
MLFLNAVRHFSPIIHGMLYYPASFLGGQANEKSTIPAFVAPCGIWRDVLVGVGGFHRPLHER